MTKYVKSIFKIIAIILVGGMTFNFLVDSYNRLTSEHNKIYHISVFYDKSLMEIDSSYNFPIIKDNYIRYTTTDGDEKVYIDFKYIITVETIKSVP